MRSRICTAAVAATLLLAIAGCGGDDDDEGTSDTVAQPEGSDAGADSDTGGGGGDGSSVTISGFAFNPDELTVAAGGSVSISNEDASSHTFTSDDDGVFEAELSANESAEVTIDADPGSYGFHCEIHPSMQGTLTVE
jgi:plastocyanin